MSYFVGVVGFDVYFVVFVVGVDIGVFLFGVDFGLCFVVFFVLDGVVLFVGGNWFVGYIMVVVCGGGCVGCW